MGKVGSPAFIKTAWDWKIILEQLTPAQCRTFCTNLAGRAYPRTLVQTPREFADVLAFLTLAQREEIFRAVVQAKVSWPDFIQTAKDLALVLEYLAPAQREEIFRSVKDRVSSPDFIKTPPDLALVLEYLAPAQREEIFRAVKAKVSSPDFIKTSPDLALVLRSLTPDQCKTIFEVRADLEVFVSTTEGFKKFLTKLPPRQRAQLVALAPTLKARWPDLVKTAHNLADVLGCCDSEDRLLAVTAFLGEAYQQQPLIKTLTDLWDVVEKLPENQREKFVTDFAAIAPLVTLVKNQKDFETIWWMLWSYLTPQQYKILKDLEKEWTSKKSDSKDSKTASPASEEPALSLTPVASPSPPTITTTTTTTTVATTSTSIGQTTTTTALPPNPATALAKLGVIGESRYHALLPSSKPIIINPQKQRSANKRGGSHRKKEKKSKALSNVLQAKK